VSGVVGKGDATAVRRHSRRACDQRRDESLLRRKATRSPRIYALASEAGQPSPGGRWQID
jgi:hypothetical protein